MKKTSLAIALIMGALILGPSAQAQEKKGQGRAQVSPEDRVKELTESLKLTDEQKPKLLALFKEQGDKLRAIFQEEGASQEDRRAKMTAMQKEYTGKIKAVLTAEQGEKYDKILAEAAAKRKKQ